MIRNLLFCILLCQATVGNCEIKLPRLISDGAVFQRDTDLKLRGWADPYEQVALQFLDMSFIAVANARGEWEIVLPAQEAGGPFEMVFSGANTLTLRDMYFGEVWLCSGQSNMELTMERVKDTYPDIIANADNPLIRQFLVPDQYDFNKEHKDLEGGNWEGVDPESIYGFSAVAYFFARELNDKYQVPIGLINAALGGSPVEAWMSEDAIKSFPESYAELQTWKDTALIHQTEQSGQQRRQSWYGELNRLDKGLQKGSEWFREDLDDSDWEEMKVPGFWADQPPGQVNGSVWFRKTIHVPPQMAGKEAKLWLGRIVDQDSVYVNGRFVGTTGYQYPPRKYTVGKNILKAGENTISIRIINQQARGGFIRDKPYFLAVDKDSIHLEGNWKYRLGAKMDPLASQTFIRWKAGGLYKRMIAPLLLYTIKGVIWYQGESNAGNPLSYFQTFPALIENWRDKWQMPELPFLYVQLANYMEETAQPAESDWAQLRQAQLETLSLPNTGMAVIIDLGEWNDIHPLNKQDVGKRLASEAFAVAYHEKGIVTRSPTPENASFHEDRVEVSFQVYGSGLKAKEGKPLRYFEISRDGKNFYSAQAEINGNTVTVSHPEVKIPLAVRYAWANNPRSANLYSTEGLPASPFEIVK